MTSNSLSEASDLIFLHRSMVKRVLALLKIDVNELMMADIITANRRPRNPGRMQINDYE